METYTLPEVLTANAREVLETLAKKQADRLLHNFIGTEHVLLGILDLGRGGAWLLIEKLGLNPGEIRRKIEDLVGMGSTQQVKGLIPFTPRAKKVVALARRKANELRDDQVGTEHLLIGLLEEGDGFVSRVLKGFGVEFGDVCQKLVEMRNPGTSTKPETEAADQAALDNTTKTLIALLEILLDKVMTTTTRNAITEAAIVLVNELAGIVSKAGENLLLEKTGQLDSRLWDIVDTTDELRFLDAAARLFGKKYEDNIQAEFHRMKSGSRGERNWGTVLQLITGEQPSKPQDYLALWKKET